MSQNPSYQRLSKALTSIIQLSDEVRFPSAPEESLDLKQQVEKIRGLADHQFDLLDHVLQTYPAAKAEPALRRALLRAKLNPSEWAVLVAQHDSDDVVGVYVVSLDDPGEVEFYSHLEQADLIYVNNMLYQHDQILLKERREQRYLYLALQSLRTVK